MMHLIQFDIAQIQRYVFGSNKLDDHIGGSLLVGDLLGRHLRRAGAALFGDGWDQRPPDDLLSGTAPALCVASSGGNATVLCREESTARALVAAVSRAQWEHAPGVSLLAAIVPCDPASFGAAIQRAARALDRQKQAHAAASFADLPAMVERCAFTDAPASEHYQKDDEPGRWISRDLRLRRDRARDDRAELERRFRDLLPDHAVAQRALAGLAELPLAEDLNHLRGAIYNRSWLGFIHLDANGLGARLHELSRGGSDAVRRLHQLSRHIDHAGLLAYADGIEWVQKRRAALSQAGVIRREALLPFRHLLLAGDDLNFLSEGSIALDLAAHLCQRFEAALRQHDRLRDISVCAGVSLSRAHAPIFHLYQQAAACCRAAKQVGRREASYLDWRLLYDESDDESDRPPGSLRPYPLSPQPGRALTYPKLREDLLTPLQREAREQRGPIQALAAALPDPARADTEVRRLSPRMSAALQDILSYPRARLGWGGLFQGSRSPLVDAVQLLDLCWEEGR